jgi:cytochrome c oxidase subunit 3
MVSSSTSLGVGSSTSRGAGSTGTSSVSAHGAGSVAAPHGAHHPRLQHHFYSMEQQLEASTLGMWVFLVTEVMFFGGLFMAYLVYRNWFFHDFEEGSRLLNVSLGATNTIVLICSSLTMAMAVRSAQLGRKSALLVNLALTMIFGSVFLVVKYFEYAEKFRLGHVPGPNFHGTPGEQIFFSLYFCLTGLHAIHMIIGLGLMGFIFVMSSKGKYTPEWYTPVEISGLYWHFVDIVWIFLFPLLYLIGGRYAI